MIKLSDILSKNEKFGEVDKEVESAIVNYVVNRMRGLSYNSADVGYALTRFKFNIIDINAAVMYASNSNIRKILSFEAKVENVNISIDNLNGMFCIDVPNKSRNLLAMGDGIKFLEEIPKDNNECLFYIGESVDGSHRIYDLADPTSCHFLIGGGTGYGKSTLIHDIILSLLCRYDKDELEINFIDLKQVTANSYKGIAQVTKIIEYKEEAYGYLQNLINIMQARNERFKEVGVEDIGQYNDSVQDSEKMPRIVLVIDEADTLLGSVAKDKLTLNIVECVRQLTALARSEGIHLILASQKPVGSNIPTVIKTNIHGRIAFKCESTHDSIAILENKLAKTLSGVGDAIAKYSVNNQDYYPRTQIAFINPKERAMIQDMLKNKMEDTLI